RVLARRTTIAVADAIAPVVTAHEVATRPAIDGAAELLEERERVAAHALDVVGRHERRRSEQHIAAGDADFEQRALFGAGLGCERKGLLGVIPAGEAQLGRSTI